jgi:restriction system protein
MIRSYEVAPYHQMSAMEFEHALAFLCRRDGCPQAQVTGRTGDLGADVIAITPDGRKLVIQAKRYVTGNLVTGPDLQKFAGTCYTIHRADIAALVTTSSFTKQARAMAAHAGILLFDADGLGGWASRTGPAPWSLVVSYDVCPQG